MNRRHLFALLGGAAVAPMVPVADPHAAVMALVNRRMKLAEALFRERAQEIFYGPTTFYPRELLDAPFRVDYAYEAFPEPTP
jgi:hypothetical protein